MITFLLPSVSLIFLQISQLLREGSMEKNVFVSKRPAESTRVTRLVVRSKRSNIKRGGVRVQCTYVARRTATRTTTSRKAKTMSECGHRLSSFLTRSNTIILFRLRNTYSCAPEYLFCSNKSAPGGTSCHLVKNTILTRRLLCCHNHAPQKKSICMSLMMTLITCTFLLH
jgi:hypothetical protein